MMKRILPLNKSLPCHIIKQTRKFNFLFKPSELKLAITEAEKLVGYSTSFLSLRCLLSDELSNVAVQVKKLVGTGHPLLKTVQKLLQEGKQSKELRGLLILLLSKAAGPTEASLATSQSIVSGIYQSQRTLAEITEIIHTASLVHRSVIDVDHCSFDNDPGLADDEDDDGGHAGYLDRRKDASLSYNGFQGTFDDLEFGNKMSTLSGDFLLASASTNLASLNNSKVVESIATAMQDLMTGEFIRTCHPSIHPSPCPLLHPHSSTTAQSDRSLPLPPTNQPLCIENWEEFTFLTAGSLLARGCQSALELANHQPEMQQKAFDFGRLIALAYQLKEDTGNLCSPPKHLNNLYFAPLIIYTQQLLSSLPKDATDATRRQAVERLHESSPKDLYRSIQGEASVMTEVARLCSEYGRQAVDALRSFEPTPAKALLLDMVNAVAKV